MALPPTKTIFDDHKEKSTSELLDSPNVNGMFFYLYTTGKPTAPPHVVFMTTPENSKKNMLECGVENGTITTPCTLNIILNY